MGLFLQSCGWMRSMRQDVYGDEMNANQASRGLAGQGNTLRQPATVMDHHLNSFRGEAVDLSGVRAKENRVTKKDFEAMGARNENSLWKGDGQTNYFFSVNQTKVPGDLVTVDVDPSLRSDMERELKRIIDRDDLDKGVDIQGFGKIGGTASGAVATAAQKPPGDDTTATAATPATPEVARTPASDAAAEKVSYIGEVVQVFPNGNLLVRGVKRFPYDGKTRMMEVTSIVKGSDVSEDNKVNSSKFYEYKAEIHQ